MINVQDLKPCFLVAARCSIHGGVSYHHEKEQVDFDGETETASWETVRTVKSKDEYAAARGIRTKFSRDLTALGVSNTLGVIVEVNKEAEIRELIEEWKEKARDFNDGSRFSKILLSVMVFKVQGENEEALEGMLYDLKDVLDALKVAIQSADYKGIRDVITRMKGFSTVLPESAAKTLTDAMDDARSQAKMIRKALEKQGQELERVQEQISTSSVDLAQFALFGEVTTIDSVEATRMANDSIADGIAEQINAVANEYEDLG